MLIARYNDLAAVEALLSAHNDIAALIVEPLQRTIPAAPGYLQGLRDLCDKHSVWLILDEIITEFRLVCGGAQEHCGVISDICTLGRIIGPRLQDMQSSALDAAEDPHQICGDETLLNICFTTSSSRRSNAASPAPPNTMTRPDMQRCASTESLRLLASFIRRLRLLRSTRRRRSSPLHTP